MKTLAVRGFALTLALLMLAALFPLSALAEGEGGDEGGETGHVCVFDQQNTQDLYLASAATCTAPASYYYSCTCGEKGTDTFASGAALGHDFSVEVPALAPTCTEAGYTAHLKCSRCDAVQGKETVDAPGHSFSVEVPALAPTCTEAGYTAHLKCSRCEETEGKTVVEALGHNWGEDGVCTRAGCGAETPDFQQKLMADDNPTEPTAADFTLTTYSEDGTYTKYVGMPVPTITKNTSCAGTYSYSAADGQPVPVADGIFSSEGHVPTRTLLDSLPDGVYTIFFDYTWEGAEKRLTVGTLELITSQAVTLHFTITGPGKVRFDTEDREIATGDVTVHVGGMYAFAMLPDEGTPVNFVKTLTVDGADWADKSQLILLIRDAGLDGKEISVVFAQRAEDAKPGVALYSAVMSQEDEEGGQALTTRMTADSAGKEGVKTDLRYAYPCWDGNAGDPMTAEEIPADGIAFTLPFPDGITADNRASYAFTVYHYHAGEIELPTFTVDEKGIQLTLKSFSPVGVLAVPDDSQDDTPAALTGTVTITPAAAKSNAVLTAAVTNTNNTGTLSYQWLRDGEEIEGATASTYHVPLADVGKALTCRVTSSVETGSIVSANSVTPTQADPPAAPTGVKKDRDIINDGDQQLGRITGTSALMEYADSADAEDGEWEPITGASFTVDEPGTYYIRYQATDYLPASKTVKVTVDAYYTITTKVLYGHGTIKPMKTLKVDAKGNYLVKAGDDAVFVFTGSLNYSVASVRVDGEEAGSARTYTFKDVQEPYELGVGFKYTGIGPRTGDGSRIELWCGAEALSLLSLLAVALFLRKHGKARA